jgi:uncharacterized protein (TIGR02147 family)
MSVFQFSDYRAYLRNHIEHLPKRGRGELSRMAQHLRVNSTLLSQVLAGNRNLSEEQTFELSTYLGHSSLESDYFTLLIQIDRAGSVNLKRHLEGKLKRLATEALKLSNRVAFEKKLSEQERAVFYSSWIYSAVHLFTSTKTEGVTIEEIAHRFRIPRNKAADLIHFLAQAGLVVETNNRYHMGTKSTFIERGTPFLLKHHSNWRIKAIQVSESISEEELMYSGQFSLSRNDFKILREALTECLRMINSTVKDSPAEELACLNIDWFWID